MLKLKTSLVKRASARHSILLMRQSPKSPILLLICLFALFPTFRPSLGVAQNLTGEIDGAVRDPQGAVIPGASLTIANTDQNLVVRSLQTDKQGVFSVPLLSIGHYSVTVKAPGFETSTVNDVEVHVNQPTPVQVVLNPGTVSQIVQVTANQLSPLLDSPEAGTLISERQVTQLSLSSRNFLQLLYLQPGISGGIPGPDDRGNVTTAGKVNDQVFSVNGQADNANGYYIDGQDMLKKAGQQPVVFPGIDFIQEINLLRGSYGAEYGGPGSATVSVQSKSGTTQFHGGAFEFFQSQVLDANGYFNDLAGVPKPGLRYNDFGYYIGGPVWFPALTKRKNTRTFFFFGQELLREEESTQQNITNVPTAAQRQGIFNVPVCVAYNAAGKCTQTATTIKTIDPTAQAYLKDIIDNEPLPNNPSDPQGLITHSAGNNNETQTIIRIDHQFSQKLSVFFRYLDDPFHLIVPNGFTAPSAIPGVATSRLTDGSTNWLGHATYVINSNNVLAGGFGSRQDWVTAQAIGEMAQANSPDIHIKLPYPTTLAQVPHLSINTATYAVTSPYDERSPLTQIFLNETSTIGRHILNSGFNLEFNQSGNNNASANAGAFTFSPGTLPAGGATQYDQAFANLLLGNVSTFTQASRDVASAPHANAYEFYVQDDFHLAPRLTLNGGVRYSYLTQPTPGAVPGSGFPLLPGVNFDPLTFNSADAPTLTSSGLICTTAPCAGGGTPNPSYNPQNGFIITGQNSPYGSRVQSQPNLTFAPRFGFAYDVFGNGKTAVRGGYGVYYLQVDTHQFQQLVSENPPNAVTTTISNTSFADPGNGIPALSSSPNGLQAMQVNAPAPYLQSWSLDVQRQLIRNSVLDIGYYGDQSIHVPALVDINEAPQGLYAQKGIIPGNTVTAGNTQDLNQIRPYPGYSFISDFQYRFTSNYNGLQVSFRKRTDKGALVAVSYTYSKALSNVGTPQNSYNISSEYGPDPNERGNVFNTNFVYPIPFDVNQSGVTGRILGGWELSGIVSYGSGQYLTATTTAVDPGGLGLLVGPATARPDRVSNPNSGAPHTIQQWFNTSAFAEVPAGQYRPGNDGVNNILGPGYSNWDLSVFRNIRLGEAANIQLRAESFNAFNHVNYSTVNTVLGNTNYGQVTDTGPARVLQMAAKITF
jgi:Carboxypeptidase regulatory-like domain/TonB-dependent Receptor Plug Domain